MSLWIENPTLSDRSNGEQLLAFQDPHWSLNSAEWVNESVVVLRLRKYPGSHIPPQVSATIDCVAGTAEVDGKRVGSLALVERALDDALVWRQSTPPNPNAGSKLRGLLHALFGRPR